MRKFYLFMAAVFAAMTWSVSAQADDTYQLELASISAAYSGTNTCTYNEAGEYYELYIEKTSGMSIWKFDEAQNFSDYDYLVVELAEAATGMNVCLYNAADIWLTSSASTSLATGGTTIKVKLADCTIDDGSLDVTKITIVGFQSTQDAVTVKIKSVYFATEDYVSAQDYTKVFSLNADDIKTNIWGETNTYSNGTITFGGACFCVGWYNSVGWDLSGYDKLIVKLDAANTTAAGNFRIYDAEGYEDKNMYYKDFTTSTETIEIDLASMTHNGTGGNSNSLELSNIYRVCFWVYNENTSVAIKSITLYKKVTIDNYNFATVTPYTGTLDFSDTDITPYVATADANGTYYLVEKQKLAAGEGALLYSTSASGGVYVPESESYVATTSGNAFVGVTPDDCDSTDESYGPYVTLTASAVDDTNISGTNYILSVESEGIGFYKANTNKVAAGNAYLQLPTGTSGGNIKFGIIGVEGEDDETTGITEVETSTTSASNAIYSIGGVRRSQLQKGINIVGGKKVIVK